MSDQGKNPKDPCHGLVAAFLRRDIARPAVFHARSAQDARMRRCSVWIRPGTAGVSPARFSRGLEVACNWGLVAAIPATQRPEPWHRRESV